MRPSTLVKCRTELAYHIVDEAVYEFGTYVESRYKQFQHAYNQKESDEQSSASRSKRSGRNQSDKQKTKRSREQRERFMRSVYHKLTTGEPLPTDQQRTKPMQSLSSLAH